MKRLITGIIAFVLLLSLVACDKQPTDPTVKPTTDTTTVSPTKPAIQTTDGKKDSLTMFREEMPDVVMAVADFGFPELSEEFGIMDHLLDEYPNWMAKHDFISNIPEEQIIQTCDYEDWGELLCFVPKDSSATVCVNYVLYSGEEPSDELESKELYRSENGEPVLILTDITEKRKVSVQVTDSEGHTAIFRPYWDYLEEEGMAEVVMDFTPVSEKTAYDRAVDYGWTVPDETFRTDHFWHSDYGYELELRYNPGQLYDGEAFIYSNKGYYGLYILAYEGYWSYANGFLTLKMDHADDIPVGFEESFPILLDPFSKGYLGLFRTEDGVGIPQFEDYIEYDELWPISNGPLTPYKEALWQGWVEPKLDELMNTGWRSETICTYAIDLMDDSVPGDNGGNVTVYDVDEDGAYTQSYSGSWDYADGMLHLTLIPKSGDGTFVDASFPVLILDGYLWIGRNDDGIALPYFHADQQADTLKQPKG